MFINGQQNGGIGNGPGEQYRQQVCHIIGLIDSNCRQSHIHLSDAFVSDILAFWRSRVRRNVSHRILPIFDHVLSPFLTIELKLNQCVRIVSEKLECKERWTVNDETKRLRIFIRVTKIIQRRKIVNPQNYKLVVLSLVVIEIKIEIYRIKMFQHFVILKRYINHSNDSKTQHCKSTKLLLKKEIVNSSF